MGHDATNYSSHSRVEWKWKFFNASFFLIYQKKAWKRVTENHWRRRDKADLVGMVQIKETMTLTAKMEPRGARSTWDHAIDWIKRRCLCLSLSLADMNDGAARARDRPCRPQKKNPTFCQFEVTRECGILVPVVFLELLLLFLLFQIRCVREKLP